MKILPKTLCELASYVQEADGWSHASRAFLDAFYSSRKDARQAMIDDEPPLTGDLYFDAYVAGMAELLACDYGLATPEWSWSNRVRFLRKPVFPSKLEKMKAYLLSSTPSAFRRRLIFTGDAPLYRPLKDHTNSLVGGA